MNGSIDGKFYVVGQEGTEGHRRPGNTAQYRIEIIAKKPQEIRIALFIDTNDYLGI